MKRLLLTLLAYLTLSAINAEEYQVSVYVLEREPATASSETVSYPIKDESGIRFHTSGITKIEDVQALLADSQILNYISLDVTPGIEAVNDREITVTKDKRGEFTIGDRLTAKITESSKGVFDLQLEVSFKTVEQWLLQGKERLTPEPIISKIGTQSSLSIRLNQAVMIGGLQKAGRPAKEILVYLTELPH